MVALRDVRWIGGGSGAGKSTVAELLGRRFGLRVMSTDLSLRRHAAAAAGAPRVDGFVAMSMDERWVEREPAAMLDTFPWFAGDGFDRLLDDVESMPGGGTVLVEGFRLLPRLVAPLLEAGGGAVWLLPTPERRAAAFEGRDAEGRAFWLRTPDPARALANVLERDRLFTERLRRDVRALRLVALDVDGGEPAEAVADRVERLLGLA